MRLWEARKKKLLFALLGGLAALVVILIIVTVALGSGREGGPAGDTFSGEPVPEDELLVSDIYNGESLIPKFDLPLNRYDPKKFKKKDGFLCYDDSSARLGVDVSEYQGEIDWAAVKEAGVDFAILRLGYRGMTKGFLNVDETFEQNYRGAADAGLSVGVYFFSQAVSQAEAEAEADFVLETLNGRKLEYPVAFDWETPVPSEKLPAEKLRAYDVAGDQAAEFGAAFCERIREGGYTPCVYTNKHLAYSFFDLDQWKDYDLWYAEYQDVPSLYYGFRMWQYTEDGKIPGVEGSVDLNICFKSY